MRTSRSDVRAAAAMIAGIALVLLPSGCGSTELPHAERADPMTLLFEHRDSWRVECVAWSPDGKTLASGNRKSIKLWDARSHELTGGFAGPVWPGPQGLAFSHDGRLFAAPGTAMQLETLVNRCGIRVWDLRDEASRGADSIELEGPYRGAGGLAFTPDGEKLVCGGYDGTVALWDPSTRKKLWEVDSKDVPEEKRDDVLSVSVDASGQLVAATGDTEHVRVLDARSGKLVHRFDVKGARCVAFARRGGALAIADDEGVRVFAELASGNGDWLLHTDAKANAVAWSPGGKLIAAACRDGGVEVFEVATGKRIERWKDTEDPCVSVCFSPDGKRVAWASWDGVVRIQSVD